MKKKGKSLIGTSGFHYKHWIGTYYPEKTKPENFMEFYLKDFKTVELNNPFYHLPTKQTFSNWHKQTPKDFIFSVKASRYITHNKKLKDPQEPLANFLENAEGLKEKLGPILFQLPPGWKFNEERLASFLSVLPKGLRATFEFRNESWYNDQTFSLLREHNIAFCIYELAKHTSPMEMTADFVYIRLHGPTEHKYQGSYPDRTLKEWAVRIKNWNEEGKDVYCYFDNDQAGYAAFNARKLTQLISPQIVKAI
jgi:uncharacterized protein YecE (DUF72 family)